MKLSLGLFFILILLSCASKMQKWELETQQFVVTSDSISDILSNQIDSTELLSTLEQASATWTEAKSTFSADTLNMETLKTLDAFNVAFSNSKNLSTEYSSCKTANLQQKSRLILLQQDIKNGNGNRANYSASVEKEKEELTIIRNHASDIRRRFEELKSSMEQFQPLLAR